MSVFALAVPAHAQMDSTALEDPSLDSLLNLSISSVSKYEQRLSEAPAAVTIISRDQIIAFGYTDLGELLTAVRELYLSDDRNYGYLGVRGFSRPTDYNNRVAIMVNQVPLNENIWGGGPIGGEFSGLNMDDVERVEVIRGPASALYGNFPMMGMINVVTLSGKSHDGARLSVEHGSFGKWQASASAGKAFSNGLDLNLAFRAGRTAGQRLYFPQFDDSTTNHGIADHLDWSRYGGVQGRVGYKGFSLKGMYTWRDVGVPTGAYETIFNDPAFHVIDAYGYLDASYTREMSSRLSLTARTWLNTFYEGGYYPYDSADGGLQREIGRGIWGGAEVRLRWDLSQRNRLLVGAEALHQFRCRYFLDYPDEVVFDQNFRFSTFGFYAQDELQVSKWLSLTAGGRFDRLYLGNLAVTPRLAANLYLHKTATVKLLYGEAFRSPTVYEANVGFDGYILPNLDLRPERIRSFELAYEQRLTKGVSIVASSYTQRLRNLIEQATVQDSLLQFQNVQRSGGFGASAEVNLHTSNGLIGYASYGFAYMRALDDGSWLTNSPQHLWKAGFSMPLLTHFRIAADLFAQSARRTVYDVDTPPFCIFNTHLVFAPRFKGKMEVMNRFEVAFKIRNLLNTEYSYPGGWEHVQPAITQNGRNFNLKLSLLL